MKVRVISGRHKGKIGEINGDLAERKQTLGTDGKVFVYITGQKTMPTWRGMNMQTIKTRHLIEEKDLFS